MSVSEYACDHYFSDLDGSNKVYALIEPVPLPVFGNSRIKDVIHDTTPGIGLSGNVESGRTVHYILGGLYSETIILNFSLANDAGENNDFIDTMKSKRAAMTDFIYSPDDGVSRYRVSFTGEDGLKFEKEDNERPSPSCKMKLLVLEKL